MAVGVGWGKDNRQHELPDNLKSKNNILQWQRKT